MTCNDEEDNNEMVMHKNEYNAASHSPRMVQICII